MRMILGNCWGLSGHACLDLDGTKLGELVDLEVMRALLEVVLVESWDSRRRRL